MDEGYDEGNALKLLGDAYAGKGEEEKAKEMYEKVVADYSGTQAAEDAENAMTGTPASRNQTDDNAADGAQASTDQTDEQE